MRSFADDADEPASCELVLFFDICVEYKRKERGNKVYSFSRFIHPVRKVLWTHSSRSEKFSVVWDFVFLPLLIWCGSRDVDYLQAFILPLGFSNIRGKEKEQRECHGGSFFLFFHILKYASSGFFVGRFSLLVSHVFSVCF